MRLLARLEEWLRKKGIFEREPTPNDRRALGIFLYFGGLSFRKAGEAVGFSQEAITEWFEKSRAFFRRLRPRRRNRIAVGARVFHLPGRDAYLASHKRR